MDESFRGQLDRQIRNAVRHFWATRANQSRKQGERGGRDRGNRTAVTGGAQLDGFLAAIQWLCREAGIDNVDVSCTERRSTYLPGYFRPTKSWDLLVVCSGQLVASIECKSQVGSFGNNFNNRCEEAIGSAYDFWKAFENGAFGHAAKPWLGYLVLLQDTAQSQRPVKVEGPHFEVDRVFREASYARRYEILCQRLVRERMYDSAALLLSNEQGGSTGDDREPNEQVSFTALAASLFGHLTGRAKLSG